MNTTQDALVQRRRRRSRRSKPAKGLVVVNAVLMLLWVGLSAGAAWLWFNPPRAQTIDLSENADASATADAIVGKPLAPIALRPLNSYREIVERPLFYQARRPPESDKAPPAPVEPPPVEEEVELTLIGIMVVGDDRSALIKNETTGKTVVVKQGDSFDSWSLGAVASDRVLLGKNGEFKEIKLIRNKRQPSQKITQQVEQLKEARRLAAERREQLRQQRLQPTGEPPPEEQIAENTGEEGEPLDDPEQPPTDENGEINPELEEVTQDQPDTRNDPGTGITDSNNEAGVQPQRTRADRTPSTQGNQTQAEPRASGG